MKEPSNVSEVRRFLGMTNHLGKFLPHLAEKTRPLRDLLRKSNMWTWGSQQQQAFDSIKQELTTPPGLALYDPNAETLVSADSSSYGMGAVLLQRRDNAEWKPVAYASRSLTCTEQRYAQIEKEALASTWACERFSEFLIGKSFCIETDHKPLVPLLGTKSLDELPPRIQRLRMRLMRFSYAISHVAGKEIATADVLSRAPVNSTPEELREEEINLYFEVAKLTSTSSEGVIEHFKSIFARHGIPDVVCSDNGPQFASEPFRKFAHDWNFSHVTSSPHFPQSNGEAERAIRTIKSLLKKSGDPYFALMAYCAAPLANGYSPAELLMGRKIRTTVPVIPFQLNPACADMENLKRMERRYRLKQQKNYNQRHRAHDMPPLQPGDHVWVKDMLQRGTVVSAAETPRSYVIETPRGMLRRNRFHLSPTSVAPETPLANTTSEAVSMPITSEVPQDSGQRSVECERRYPARVRRPPVHLQDYSPTFTAGLPRGSASAAGFQRGFSSAAGCLKSPTSASTAGLPRGPASAAGPLKGFWPCHQPPKVSHLCRRLPDRFRVSLIPWLCFRSLDCGGEETTEEWLPFFLQAPSFSARFVTAWTMKETLDEKTSTKHCATSSGETNVKFAGSSGGFVYMREQLITLSEPELLPGDRPVVPQELWRRHRGCRVGDEPQPVVIQRFSNGGYYDKPKDLLEQLVPFLKKYDPTAQASYNPVTRRIDFKGNAPYPCDLRIGIYNLFVYTDIIQYQQQAVRGSARFLLKPGSDSGPMMYTLATPPWGIGSIFSKLFRFISPLMKRGFAIAKPHLKSAATNIVSDNVSVVKEAAGTGRRIAGPSRQEGSGGIMVLSRRQTKRPPGDRLPHNRRQPRKKRSVAMAANLRPRGSPPTSSSKHGTKMAHQKSPECTLAELDLFSAPMMQLSIEDKLYTEILPLSAITDGGPIEVFYSQRWGKIFGSERHPDTTVSPAEWCGWATPWPCREPNALYPLSRVMVKTFSIPANSRICNQDNLFLGPIPKYLVLGMVHHEAFTGKRNLSPFNFIHNDSWNT
ncbi:hypothetical protein L3Q82_003311 [Scortum barcoo]|uniref:Uncharacterized protein n=1 Tax=Scortum barcoo TaxID=214431 RepID=A0ACB8VN87_9TELE|nr:hypothetical protein L3Q82_003311 [Scortum barcoo]